MVCELHQEPTTQGSCPLIWAIASVTFASIYNQHFSLLQNSTYSSALDFIQLFDHYLFCNPHFLNTVKYNSTMSFFLWLFLFRKTYGVSNHQSAETESIIINLSFSCPVVLTSTVFDPVGQLWFHLPFVLRGNHISRMDLLSGFHMSFIYEGGL